MKHLFRGDLTCCESENKKAGVERIFSQDGRMFSHIIRNTSVGAFH